MFKGAEFQGNVHEKYLILRLDFSAVSPNDVDNDFRTYVNSRVAKFSEKYVKSKHLDKPIDINEQNHVLSLLRLLDVVELSGQRLYLMVDEYDSFMNQMLIKVDTTVSELGKTQYLAKVENMQSVLRSFGNVAKFGTAICAG